VATEGNPCGFLCRSSGVHMWRRVWWSATGFSTVALSRATIAKPTRLFALAPFAMGGGGKWYAVARGRKMGIFTSWPECQEQVKVRLFAPHTLCRCHECFSNVFY
jgi:hypothetical protein